MCTLTICLLDKKKMEKNSKSRSPPASHKPKETSILIICLVRNRSLSSRRYIQPHTPHLTPHTHSRPHTSPRHLHFYTLTTTPPPSIIPSSLYYSLLPFYGSPSQLFHCSLLAPHNPTPPTCPNLNDRSVASHLRQQVSRPLYP